VQSGSYRRERLGLGASPAKPGAQRAQIGKAGPRAKSKR
jgi:hypothetical protein